MSDRTQGEWELTFPYVFAVGENGANICAISEPRATSTVGYTPVEVGSKDSKEAVANARLIVSAPDLQNAAMFALAAIRGEIPPSVAEFALEQALGKVGGREHRDSHD